MLIHTKEHYELISEFERNFKGIRLDKEKNKELWKKGHVYENGETNSLFLAFRLGYSVGKVVERECNLTIATAG